jgi:hypothetical protein
MEAALGQAPVQEKGQNACRVCLVRDFWTSFVPSLVLILVQAMDDQVVLVAHVEIVKV